MKTFFRLFPLLLGASVLGGAPGQFSRFDGFIFLSVGIVLCFCRFCLPFLRRAIAEGSAKEAAAVERFTARNPEPEPLPVEPEPAELEPTKPEPVSAENLLLRQAFQRQGLSAPVEVPETVRWLALGLPLVDPKPVEEPEADLDEAFCGLDEDKERVRLEKVLEGLYNKRDKLIYIGVNRNTQRWRGLEYDIAAVERRLYALREM